MVLHIPSVIFPVEFSTTFLFLRNQIPMFKKKENGDSNEGETIKSQPFQLPVVTFQQ